MIKNTYDSLGRITGINHSRQDETLADYHYKWDAANRITEINDDKYGYDKTNQLLSAVYAKKPKEQYAYDLNGNRLTALLQGQEKKYETGKFNRLLSENGEKLEYDAEGNRISKGNTKYFWDHRNRLIKVVSPSETIDYTYDYQNRLVSRKTEKGKEYFVHDGWQIVLILNGNGSVKERFLWGTKQDELICENDNWTLGDHLNTIREVVDTSGKTLAHCDYNAFGKCLSPLKDLSFAYTGKLTDSATNLQWNINRWYDSSVGRWISEDPIGFKGKDENLYRYVKNTSIAKFDPDGLACRTSPPNRYCCKKFTQVYKTEYQSVDACVNAIITSTWWGDYSDSTKTGAVAVAVALLSFLKLEPRLNAALSLSTFLGSSASSDVAMSFCKSYYCELPYGQKCGCCGGSFGSPDYWDCSCTGTGRLYPGNGDQWYSDEPSGTLAEVTAHWLW